MKVFELTAKVFLKEPVPLDEGIRAVTEFIDCSLASEGAFLQMHQQKGYKYYCHDNLYPLAPAGKAYRKEQIYAFRVRTINPELAGFLRERLPRMETGKLKGLTAAARILPERMIRTIFSITPVILKSDGGYWRGTLEIKDFERRIRENLIKKRNDWAAGGRGEKTKEEIPFYSGLIFLNKGPIRVPYKNILLLGDKIELEIETDRASQELARIAIGTGLGENNSRGGGFVNFRWKEEGFA